MGNSQKKNIKNDAFRYDNQKISIKPPPQFITKDEFFKNWCTWKINFLLFKKASSKQNSDKQWGNVLLNLMGPIGQNIHSTFTFNSPKDSEDLNVLLQKFDEYSIFSGKKKLPLENVYEYINDLQSMIKERNINDGEKLIRNKILTEIDKHQFINAAQRVIPTFTFSSNFNELTIKEIAFIWNNYATSMFCELCGSIHTTQKCQALGKQCLRCNEWNHFTRKCPKNIISDCNYCGGTHTYKNCPSYNEICTKCNRSNHFSWKCQHRQILQCYFCGLSHAASKSLCPANNSICTNCNIKGHFASKCKKNSHRRNY